MHFCEIQPTLPEKPHEYAITWISHVQSVCSTCDQVFLHMWRQDFSPRKEMLLLFFIVF